MPQVPCAGAPEGYHGAVAESPPAPGPLEGIPPALRARLGELLAVLPTRGQPLDGSAAERLTRVLADGEPWLGAEPALAELGVWMIEPRHTVELRRRGCTWLAMFPTPDTVKRLAALAAAAATPSPVREQAIWSLGYRQVRALHPSTRWTPDAVQLADEALYALADAANLVGSIGSDQLPQALRHVQADAMAAVFARAPGLWGAALECFATPPLARVLFVSLDDIPPQHRMRALRLIGATLGAEAVPLLVTRAALAPLEQRIEMLLLAVALGGEAQLPALEDALRGTQLVERVRDRARWHLQHKGVVPTVRGLKIARTTTVIAPAERAAACARGADDLAAFARFARHAEPYVYTLWAWLVRGAGDPARAREVAAAHPESQRIVRDLYFAELARRGRYQQLAAAASVVGGADVGALQLAIAGRPLAALELAATVRGQSAELACARALACYRAGRPDLTTRILVEDLPQPEATGDAVAADTLEQGFPGPNERWLVDHAPESHPALAGLAGGRAGVLALARAAAHDADPDLASLEPIAAVTRRLGRGIAGATVYLAGEFKFMNRDSIAAALERAGARLVAGPYPGTDYYVHGDRCLVATVAQLERLGARRLRREEVEAL